MYIFLLRLGRSDSPLPFFVLALKSLGEEPHCEIWRLVEKIDIGHGHRVSCPTDRRLSRKWVRGRCVKIGTQMILG